MACLQPGENKQLEWNVFSRWETTDHNVFPGGADMIVTTTPSIEGKKIRAYLGLVTGEAIMGANLFKDLFAGIRDLVGGRSAAYERELGRARQVALKELEERAAALGADSIVGVDIDYEVLGQNNGMLMVSVSGTAVKTA